LGNKDQKAPHFPILSKFPLTLFPVGPVLFTPIQDNRLDYGFCIFQSF